MLVHELVPVAGLGLKMSGSLASHSTMLLYLGPETLMPLASILGVIIGILLIFWRLLIKPFKKIYKLIKGTPSETVDSEALGESQRDTQE